MTSSAERKEDRKLSLGNDLRIAGKLDGRTWRDCARAVAELAIARVRLRFNSVQQILAVPPVPRSPAQVTDARLARMVDGIAFAIPRMGARVPWKGTCLVQALAAQRWLSRRGIASEIVLGARKAGDSGIDAHAWLKAGDRIVVGGDLKGYQAFRPSQMR